MKDKLIAAIREVPISKTYEEYVEALADRLENEIQTRPIDRIISRMSEAEKEKERLLEVLKTVAKSIQESGMEQPSMCLFGYGTCGYPIDDCFNCPCHSWSVNYFPITHCEFK